MPHNLYMVLVWHVGDEIIFRALQLSWLSSMSWTPFADQIPNWSRLLTVLGVGFPVGMSLQFLLDPGCPTCINTELLFTLSHIANLTSLLSSLRKILENLYCLSKRGVDVHPKVSGARKFFLIFSFSLQGPAGWDQAGFHRDLQPKTVGDAVAAGGC
ncbi:hypothetical protein L3X38_042717 [Prunus dulcis]|uniref:Uncharacterized protein n=1 Tax=Prunus dulcis TaxID=3755 RepID=A0AAD4UWT2_PRUDU|nr:hypothetical protein L3X38_042717 [Prunus dulcis]